MQGAFHKKYEFNKNVIFDLLTSSAENTMIRKDCLKMIIYVKVEFAMPKMDEFREEREASLRETSLWGKIKYYVYYYKGAVFAVLVIGIIAAVWIHDTVTAKDSAFYAAMVNVSPIEEANDFENAFASYSGIDTDQYELTMDTALPLSYEKMDQMSMNVSQKLFAMLSTGHVDVMVADLKCFENYAGQGIFYDLRDILTEEQLAAYQPYLYYVDQKTLDALKSEDDQLGSSSNIKIPDPSKPDNMAEPVPVGIFIGEGDCLSDYYYFDEDGAALGIPCNTKQLDHAIDFLLFILHK